MIEFFYGQIVDSPASAAEQVRVATPFLNQSGNVVYGPMIFRPEVCSNGSVRFPQRGDSALIARDTIHGREWVVSWDRSDSTSPNTNSLEVVVPLGASLEWNAAGDPPGGKFLVEDGRTLNATADATLLPLWSVIGTIWGGTGISSFKIPDSRSRAAIGAGQGTGLTDRTLGATGGEENHLLTAAESGLPSHAHQLQIGNAGFFQAGSNRDVQQNTGTNGGVTQSTGGSAAVSTHNNMQPYIVKNKIIRVR